MGNIIKELFCWVTLDTGDGNEGIPAGSIMLGGEPHMMPLLGADRERIASIRPQLIRIAAEFPPDTRFSLRRFVFIEEVETYSRGDDNGA